MMIDTAKVAQEIEAKRRQRAREANEAAQNAWEKPITAVYTESFEEVAKIEGWTGADWHHYRIGRAQLTDGEQAALDIERDDCL